MARLNITQLPLPPRPYRVDLAANPSNGGGTFETYTQAGDENKCRARLLEQAARMATDKSNRLKALRLAHELRRSSVEEVPPESPVCSIYLRDQRIRIPGALWQLADQVGSHATENDLGRFAPHVRSVSVFRADWEMTLVALKRRTPASFLERLRVDLYDCSAGDMGGGAVFALHGEYNPAAGIVRVHAHGIIYGEVATAIDGLRGLPGYRPIRHGTDDNFKMTPAIRLSRSPLTNPPHPYTYCVQPFWPCRWEGEIDGKLRRQSFKSRIPEPAHSQILLWLDRWHLKDLILVMGLQVTDDGLHLTKPLYRMNSD